MNRVAFAAALTILAETQDEVAAFQVWRSTSKLVSLFDISAHVTRAEPSVRSTGNVGGLRWHQRCSARADRRRVREARVACAVVGAHAVVVSRRAGEAVAGIARRAGAERRNLRKVDAVRRALHEKPVSLVELSVQRRLIALAEAATADSAVGAVGTVTDGDNRAAELARNAATVAAVLFIERALSADWTGWIRKRCRWHSRCNRRWGSRTTRRASRPCTNTP